MDWKRFVIGKWSWKRPFYSLASIYVLLAVIAVFFADRLIFLPPPATYDGRARGLIRLRTEAGESIAAVYLPAREGMPTLLYSHGNAEDVGQSTELYERWNGMGFGVLAYDYPGYGLSSGEPSEKSCLRAAGTAWDFLEKSGVAAKSVVVVGRSVGSGPGTWIASREKPAGLVLISPFTSTFAAGIPWLVLPRDRFRNLPLIEKMEIPLLVIHGEKDTIIRPSHGRKLYEVSAAEDKTLELVPEAGHNDLYLVAGDEVVRWVAEFAARVGGESE